MPTAARSDALRLCLAQRGPDHRLGALPDLDRVVLDPAGLRQDLLVLELVDALHVAGVVEDHEAGAGGALVDGADEVSHQSGSFRCGGAAVVGSGRVGGRAPVRSLDVAPVGRRRVRPSTWTASASSSTPGIVGCPRDDPSSGWRCSSTTSVSVYSPSSGSRSCSPGATSRSVYSPTGSSSTSPAATSLSWYSPSGWRWPGRSCCPARCCRGARPPRSRRPGGRCSCSWPSFLRQGAPVPVR